jgi:hypothetical protein
LKVRELIEKLSVEDQEAEVLVQCESFYDCSYLGPAEFVKETYYHTRTAKVPAVKITQTENEE